MKFHPEKIQEYPLCSTSIQISVPWESRVRHPGRKWLAFRLLDSEIRSALVHTARRDSNSQWVGGWWTLKVSLIFFSYLCYFWGSVKKCHWGVGTFKSLLFNRISYWWFHRTYMTNLTSRNGREFERGENAPLLLIETLMFLSGWNLKIKANVTLRTAKILSKRRDKHSTKFANNWVFSFVLTTSEKLIRKWEMWWWLSFTKWSNKNMEDESL